MAESVNAVTQLVTLAAAGLASAPLWSFLTEKLKLGAKKATTEVARLDLRITELTDELKKCKDSHHVVETRLRAIEQRSTSYFAMWIKDRNQRLVWLNDKAFLTLFAPLGYARDELDGKTFRDLLDPVAAAEIEQLDKAALAYPGHTQSLLIQLHPDLPFLVVIKVAAVSTSGEVQYEGCAYNPGDPEIRSAAGTRRQIVQRSESIEHMLENGCD